MAGQAAAPGTGSGANNAGGGTGSPSAAPSGDNTPNTDLELEDQATGGSTPPAARTYTEAEAQALRQEAAKNRVELQKAQKRLKDIDDLDKSEAQKATDRAEAAEKKLLEAEERINTAARRDAITAAVKGIALDPNWVADKITAADVPIDAATGKPDEKLLTAKIAQLRTQYPALFKAADGASDAGAQGTGVKANGDMNGMMRGLFGRK